MILARRTDASAFACALERAPERTTFVAAIDLPPSLLANRPVPRTRYEPGYSMILPLIMPEPGLCCEARRKMGEMSSPRPSLTRVRGITHGGWSPVLPCGRIVNTTW